MKIIHIIFAILVSAIWGANFVITKWGLQDLPPILFTCLRYTLVMFPIIFFIKKGNLSWKLILQIGTTLGIFTFTLAFIGIALGVDAGITSLLMQFQIIFTLILSAMFLKDIPNKSQISGAIIAIFGVFILIYEANYGSTLIGVVFVISGAFFSGLTKIFMKKGGKYNAFSLMIWMSIIPPIPLLLLSLFFETGQLEAIANVSYKGISALLFNAFVSTILGFGLIGYLIRLYSPNQIAPFAFLVPVFGLFLGFIFFNETLGYLSMFACFLILFGFILPHYMATNRSMRVG